jgi:plasmid stabilization system protein ParE
MIRLSPAARAQVSSLIKHYTDLDGPEAVRNPRAAIARGGDRIETRRGPFYPAPRPHPALARTGWLWLKEGPYWIAYADDSRGIALMAIFHEAANIPGRIWK